MPRISVDATSTEVINAMPAGTTAISHIEAIETSLSKIKTDEETGQEYGGSPMATLTWVLDEGPFKGRRVSFHYVMLGGTTKKGEPMPIRALCELIQAVKAPWASSPDKPLVARPFKWVKNEQKNDVPVDPDTGERLLNVDCNMPEDFINKQARVRYKVRGNFNEVDKLAPVS